MDTDQSVVMARGKELVGTGQRYRVFFCKGSEEEEGNGASVIVLTIKVKFKKKELEKYEYKEKENLMFLI